MSRATRSVTPPAPNGTTIFTGFMGYGWAKAALETRSPAHNAMMRAISVIETVLLRAGF
jgi:hypothetical protein